MKKIFSLFLAMAAMFTVNAATYNMVGEFNGWSNGAAPAFAEVSAGNYEITIPDFWGEAKVIVDNNWVPQYGAVNAGDSVMIGQTYALKGKLVNEEQDPGNLRFGEKSLRYKNAKLTLKVEGEALSITFVSGEAYDPSSMPDTYQIVGGFTNNWSTNDAIQFEEVEGVLTASVPDLNGTFKIIKNRGWGEQWATNWETGAGLALGEPYVLGAKTDAGDPSNLALANPFGGYKNAVLTLKIEENGDVVLTLVSGEFYVVEADWHIPGTKLGWNCDEAQRFAPVEGEANTYELLVAEFGADFKVVYGNWAVEFGAPSEDAKWEINKEYTCAFKGGNIHAVDNSAVFIDCTIRLVVDYENVSVKLSIMSDHTDVENVVMKEQATKVIENGQLFIIRDNVRYNTLGAIVK